MSFHEQWQWARCASLLVGTHGAGMSWFVFAPRNASAIEIVFDGWHSLFNGYVNTYRPDMNHAKLSCERVTSVDTWKKYARMWFNYTGPIDSGWIKNLTATSFQAKSKKRHTATPLKDSDVTCSPAEFKQVILQLQNNTDHDVNEHTHSEQFSNAD